jgi:hypothetical protein
MLDIDPKIFLTRINYMTMGDWHRKHLLLIAPAKHLKHFSIDNHKDIKF